MNRRRLLANRRARLLQRHAVRRAIRTAVLRQASQFGTLHDDHRRRARPW